MMVHFANSHPVLFIIGASVVILTSMAHLVAAVEYSKKLKRSTLEALALVLLGVLAWPLVALVMMARGYADLYTKTWE